MFNIIRTIMDIKFIEFIIKADKYVGFIQFRFSILEINNRSLFKIDINNFEDYREFTLLFINIRFKGKFYMEERED